MEIRSSPARIATETVTLVDVPEIPYDRLRSADLRVGVICRSGEGGGLGGEPVKEVLAVDNLGGFRSRGPRRVPGVLVIALVSDLQHTHWPDGFRDDGRRFIYFGDNDSPAKSDLHKTNKDGNLMLRDMFHALHAGRWTDVPPIFVFTKAGRSRDMRFEGMAVPGAAGVEEDADLVAFWTSTPQGRFLNYRAMFSMIPERTISSSFVASVRGGEPDRDVAPPSWLRWREIGPAALGHVEPIARPWHDDRRWSGA